MFPKQPTSSDSTPTAEQLAAELERGFTEFRDLLQKLQLTPEQLDLLLDEDETRDTLRIRAKLVAHQLKLMALCYAPHAFTKLAQLTESEKPEVARRACNAVLRIAGIAPDQLERGQVRKEKLDQKQQEQKQKYEQEHPRKGIHSDDPLTRKLNKDLFKIFNIPDDEIPDFPNLNSIPSFKPGKKPQTPPPSPA